MSDTHTNPRARAALDLALEHDATQFARELVETRRPSLPIADLPARMVL